IYKQRNAILNAEDLSDSVKAIRHDVVQELVHGFMPPSTVEEQWDVPGLEKAISTDFQLKLDIEAALKNDINLHIEDVCNMVHDALAQEYEHKEADVEAMGVSLRKVEQHMMLQVLDRHWKEHLANMDHLRQGIHLRGYAQRNPKQEYKLEGFELFQTMLNEIEHEFIRVMSTLELRTDDEERLEQQRAEEARRQAERMQTQVAAMEGEEAPAEAAPAAQQPVVREGRKMRRNEPRSE